MPAILDHSLASRSTPLTDVLRAVLTRIDLLHAAQIVFQTAPELKAVTMRYCHLVTERPFDHLSGRRLLDSAIEMAIEAFFTKQKKAEQVISYLQALVISGCELGWYEATSIYARWTISSGIPLGDFIENNPACRIAPVPIGAMIPTTDSLKPLIAKKILHPDDFLSLGLSLDQITKDGDSE